MQALNKHTVTAYIFVWVRPQPVRAREGKSGNQKDRPRPTEEQLLYGGQI
jgi:hypothetical protein